MQIFASVFDINKDKLSLDTKREDILAWDSISHLLLIMKIEAQFNIKLKTEEVIGIDSIKKCFDVVESAIQLNK